jgi:Flp pilus assembly protein TadB
VPPLDPLPEFDLYAELDIAPGADVVAIERAWRAGVRSVHPDRARKGEERAATQRTARLNIAREWLMDPAKRARYDELRRPSPRVEIPYIDPLGAWPERTRTRARARAEARAAAAAGGRRRGLSSFFLQRPVMVALAILLIAVVYGIDANPLLFTGVALAVLVLGWYVWFAVVGALVGAWFRWRDG